MALITVNDPQGCPMGTYDVFYYELKGGQVRQEAGFDSNTSHVRVKNLQQGKGLVIGANEAAHAICRSSPGGCWIYGSRKMQRLVNGEDLSVNVA